LDGWRRIYETIIENSPRISFTKTTMLLKFPNLDVLRQCLSKKIVPPALSQTAVTAGFDDQDQLWVDTAAALNRTVLADLRKLNVQAPRSCSIKLPLSLPTWDDLANAQRYLLFPDLKTFNQALTNGSVPVGVSQAPALAGFDDQDRLWIETPAALPQASIKHLRKFGVLTAPRSEAGLMVQVACWLELTPLAPDPASTEHLEQTPVLFDLPTGERLAQLVSEILRLGNDRQTYRWVEDGCEESSRGLLRVVGPPYYSLLRAIDRHGDSLAPVAFAERAPRVWVELGYAHPLVEHIKPTAGQMLLIRPPRQWTVIEETPFRDVYEVMEFNLPDLPIDLKEGELDHRIQVSLSLRTSGAAEGGELWVLRDNPIDVLNSFVQNADDQLLHRLAFAVGQHDGRATIVVRTLQSKMPPPVLVLNATAYRPFLKLPNLFLPCGKSLHPPLRRDQVRKLLADDSSQITWLLPTGPNSFTPQSLPEDAFRPLSDWVEYVLDHDKELLQAWMQAAQFDFEPFICDEEPQGKPRKTGGSERPARGRSSGGQSQDLDLSEGVAFTGAVKKVSPGNKDRELDEDVLEVAQTEPEILALQQERRDLEELFQSLEGSLDVPKRQELWPELARVNASLGNVDDSRVCWLNALWGQDAPPIDWTWRWFSAEATGVPIRNEANHPRNKSWVTRLTAAGVRNRDINGEDLDWLLNMKEPSTADLRALTALLVWVARRVPAPQPLLDRLNPIQRFLEAHEKLVPVRAVWLAWLSLIHLSKGDVLALARARDRLLERLFQNGLRPEQDLPSFLRFSGQPTSQRFRAMRKWFTDLADLAQTWVEDKGSQTISPPMNAYVYLIFSFGLARLGESDASRELLARAKTAMPREKDVHQFLLKAYEYRITQALESKPHAGPLPTEQLEKLEQMPRLEHYVVDKLREHARILEPNQKIDPYRHWSSRMSELERELAELVDVNDRKEVVARVQRLLRELGRGAKTAEPRARILRSALDLAPRISEDFAREILDQAIPAYDALLEAREPTPLMELAKFLEKALSVAAHFDRIEQIHPLVNRFQALLQAQKGDKAVHSLESLAGQCFRGLRKLGMRDEIDQMLTLLANVILEGQDLQGVDAAKVPAGSWRALLHVASGWFYFGKDRLAEPVLQAVRSMLFREELVAREKSALACVYATTVGQAQVEVAQKRLEEIFQKLNGVHDGYTTKDYYRLLQLDVIEAVVLAVASDDFTQGPQARRWLDDDEFIVRRRIHRDMRHWSMVTGH
jgi:cellulose synthase operon protein C